MACFTWNPTTEDGVTWDTAVLYEVAVGRNVVDLLAVEHAVAVRVTGPGSMRALTSKKIGRTTPYRIQVSAVSARPGKVLQPPPRWGGGFVVAAPFRCIFHPCLSSNHPNSPLWGKL